MREPKFRAWDIQAKKMYDVVSIAWRPFNDGKLEVYVIDIDGKNIGWLVNDESNHQFEIVQYTGYEYENGVEVYEGDIIEVELDANRAFSDGKPDVFRLVVTYEEFHTHFTGRRIGTNSPYGIEFGGDAVIRKEVIGNIYENPELLKNGK